MSNAITADITLQIPNLRAYARVMTRDSDRADDLVQTCLERALRSVNQFTAGTNLRAWLFTILRNAHINEIRRQSKWTGSVDSAVCEDLFPVAASQDKQLEMRDFKRVYSQLSRQDQDVLWLVGADGLSYQEAAARLKIPVGTVRSRLSRARTRLRDLLDSGEGHPERDDAQTDTVTIH